MLHVALGCQKLAQWPYGRVVHPAIGVSAVGGLCGEPQEEVAPLAERVLPVPP